MADCVAGRVEDVEAAVFEIVMGLEVGNFELRREREFDELAVTTRTKCC